MYRLIAELTGRHPGIPLVACILTHDTRGAFVRWSTELLSVTAQRGNEVFCGSGRFMAGQQGMHYATGLAVVV